MIKLSEDSKNIVVAAAKYCSLVKIEAVMIDKKGIRAKQDDFAVYVIEPGDFSYLEFDEMFLNRVDSFAPRIKMFESSKIDFDIYVETKENDSGDTFVTKAILKGGKTSVEVTCGNPSIVARNKWPKKFNDPIDYEFSLDKDELALLKRGLSAMGADHFEVLSEDGVSVSVRIIDIEGDVLNKELDKSLTILNDDAEEELKFSYIFKILIPLLTQAVNQDSEIRISRKGVMCLSISGLSVYIFPGTD